MHALAGAAAATAMDDDEQPAEGAASHACFSRVAIAQAGRGDALGAYANRAARAGL